MYKHVTLQHLNQYMTSKSRGHCDNIKIFNQGKSNQIREKSENLIAKNVWPPWLMQEGFLSFKTENYIIELHYLIMNHKIEKITFSHVRISDRISLIIRGEHGIHCMPCSSLILSEMTP